jgi:hypothetical protein
MRLKLKAIDHVLLPFKEQRQVNSKMTQTEQSNSLENPEQLEEKVVAFDPQSKTYYLRKQKQETLQAIKEIEILFEYTKSEKAEIVQMKARNEDQQSSIVQLKAEKQQQNLLIMSLEVKLGGAIQKLQKTKEDIRNEKELIEKVWADVKTERELIDCRRNEFMNEREIFKALIMHDKPIRHTEPTKTNKQLLTLHRFSFFGGGKCFVLNAHDERRASSESALAFADCLVSCGSLHPRAAKDNYNAVNKQAPDDRSYFSFIFTK